MKQIFCSLFFVFFSTVAFSQQHLAQQGLLNLRDYNFTDKGSVALNGEWKFYMSALIPPGKMKNSPEPFDYVGFPSVWNDISKSLDPGNGFATYNLKVVVKPQTYSLELPHFYSNYSLWINNYLIASNGVVGNSKETSKPQWRPQTVSFIVTKDTLDIVIHVSNFNHAKGGVREKILLGLPSHLNFKREIALTSYLVLFGILFLIGLTFLFIFFFVKRKGSAVFFALLCFTWGIRVAFSNVYLVTFYYPDFPWELSVKIEYLTLYLTMVWASMFLSKLFPDDISHLFKWLFVGCNIVFAGFTLLTSASLYTQFLPVYLSFSVALLLYIIYVLITAVVHERSGVWLIVTCLLVGVVAFSYDLVSYQVLATFNPIIINSGYIVMFGLLATGLAIDYGFLKRTKGNRDMLTYEDLYGSARK